MITSKQISAILDTVHGVTFAGIETLTPVATSAANRDHKILKRTVAQVQLFNGIKDMEIYAKAVQRSSGTEDFKTSETHFRHTDVFSVVENKKSGKAYLYCVYKGTSSVEYTVDGRPATKEEVADYLTPSAREALLNPKATVYNKANDVEHNVIVRTIALENIKRITSNGVTITSK